MKKCPTCEKTFDDTLKFCQTDGTPLVAVEEAAPEDPYKTTVANASDLPIPPLDPFKTMIGSPIAPHVQEPQPEIEEDILEISEPEVDSMKTIVSTDFPPFNREAKPEVREEPKPVAPPSPFGNPPLEPKAESPGAFTATPPDPPKFSEPDLNPPNFSDPPPKFTPPPPPLKAPSEPVSPPAPSKPFEMSQPEIGKANDFSGDSPYGDTKNAPIPSPFDLSMPPGYQIPSAPMPPYKEAEIEEVKAEALNTPFAEEVKENQQGWTPPPAPNADWQNQQIGQNTPSDLAPAGAAGQNKTLAFVSLGLGIVGLVLLVPTLIIPLCGVAPFFLGIGAAITGFLARSRAKAQPEQYGGGGLGIAGLLLGLVCIIAPIAIFILTFAVMYVYRG